jgi:tetratricopeptide (TPR) repeat protein
MRFIRNIEKTWLLILLVGVALFAYSCEKNFLDLTPQQSVAEEEFLKTLSDFKAAILGIYDQLQLSDLYGRYTLLVPDVMGRDVKQNAQANRAKAWAEYNGSTSTVHRIDREFWAEYYEAINMANKIINADYDPPTEQARKEYQQILGEAYALRALCYFDLVRIFAQHYTFTADASHPGVPIVLQSDITQKPARNTVKEVYDQIISDFQKGIELMTMDPPNNGYMSKEAAQALLSRVYLYKEDWANAEAMATAVINSGKFNLIPREEYKNMFFPDLSSEVIFGVIFTLTDNPGSNHLGRMYKASGYGDYLPSNDLLSLLDSTDVRWVMFREDPNLGGEFGKYRVDKWPSEGSEIDTDDIPIIRLAEVYLNRAEARYHLGNYQGAIEDLMTVRRRAWPTAPDVTATGDALLEEILNERRRELCFEGHGIWDITRYKMDLVRNDCTAPVCYVPYPDPRFVLPIPFEEVDVNPNIEQNPGY